MARLANQNIASTLDVVGQMLALADKGDVESEDDGCMMLFGLLRDCAYRIRREAERERDQHRSKGIWDID